jgi:hypothetical protein
VKSEALSVGEGLGVGAPDRVLLQHRHLTEYITGTEDGEDNLATSLSRSRDLHLSTCDELQVITWVAFAKDV